MKRIKMNYFTIITFNSALILMGMTGLLAPGTAAYAHNFSTMALSLHSMTNLKKKKRERFS
jgi:cation transport ATPase